MVDFKYRLGICNCPPFLRLAIIAGLFPLVVSFLIPPTWNYIDSILLFMGPPKDLLPHYAPLYPYFVYTMRLFFGETDLCVYSIVILQHALFAGASIYAARSFSEINRQILFVIACNLSLGVLLANHGLFQESLFLSFELFFFGAFFRVTKGVPSIIPLLMYFLFLGLMILVRHIGPVFASLLPLYLLTGILFSSGVKRAIAIYRFFGVIFLSVVVIFLASSVANFLVLASGSQNQFLIGRPGIYRIASAEWDSMSDKDKNALLFRLKARTTDPVQKETFEAVINAKHLWCGAYDAVDSLIQKHSEGVAGQHPRLVDEYLNQAYFLFMTTPSFHVYFPVFKDMFRILGNMGADHFFASSGIRSVKYYNSQENIRSAIRQIDSLKPEKARIYGKFEHFIPIYIWGKIPTLLVLLYCLILAKRFWATSPKNVQIALALIGTGLVYCLIHCLTTIYLFRYGLPYSLCIYSALGLLLPGCKKRQKTSC